MAKKCFKPNTNSKKLKLRLDYRVDDELPLESAKLSNENNILKISNKLNTLHTGTYPGGGSMGSGPPPRNFSVLS